VRGNLHAAFDVAGAGNVAWSRWCDTRRRKGEPTGNTNFDLNRRVSPRPYPSREGTRMAVSAGADFGCVQANAMRLRESQMMRVARLSSADQTRLGCDEFASVGAGLGARIEA
jgi:hypothetical protein